MPLYAYSVTFSKRKKCVGFFIGLYIPRSCWAFMVEPHRHLGHWSCPLRPTEVMGSLGTSLFPRSGTFTPSAVTPPDSWYGLSWPLLFQFTFSGSGFQTSQEVRSDQLGRHDPVGQYFQAQTPPRPPGRPTGVHWRSGHDFCCGHCLVNYRMTTVPRPC